MLLAVVLVIPIYFTATHLTSNQDDAEFAAFLVAIVLGITFGPLIDYFLHRHD